jgi:hypothetical protein
VQAKLLTVSTSTPVSNPPQKVGHDVNTKGGAIKVCLAHGSGFDHAGWNTIGITIIKSK